MAEVKPNDKQIDAIKHSLGLNEVGRDKRKRPYRNYYCTTKGDVFFEEMVVLGWFKAGGVINDGTSQYYRVTKEGAALVDSKLPKDED